MIDRLITLLISVALAFLVWLYASSRDQENLDNVPIPVRISLTPAQVDHYDLEVNGPSQVAVSFSGPPSRMRELRGLLQRGLLTVDVQLAVPEERQTEGRYLDTVLVTPADMRTPPGVSAVVVEGRNRIPVTLRRLVERRLPVRLDCPTDDRIARVTLDPSMVVVRGPHDVLDQLRSLSTQPFYLPNSGDTPPGKGAVASGTVPLLKEVGGRPVQTVPESVRARIQLKPQQKLFTLTDVPVQFLCPSSCGMRPKFVGGERSGKVTVHVQGPVTDDPPSILVFIDLTRRKFTPGLYADEPLQLQLPKDYQIAQTPPRSAAFELQALPSLSAHEPGLGLKLSADD